MGGYGTTGDGLSPVDGYGSSNGNGHRPGNGRVRIDLARAPILAVGGGRAETIGPERFARAKRAYTTRFAQRELVRTLVTAERAPRAGDLVLARVDEIGQHKKLERPDGRQATLFPGDEIVVAYGDRYAPDQFEAEVPGDLGPCHLVAGGGVASQVLSWHADMDPPTVIEPLGLLGDGAGRVLNLADFALPPVAPLGPRPPVIASVGTSMNSGKTTSAAFLVKGLVAAGLKVGAAKVTGTGSGKDLWLMADAGADPVLDFTHAGFPSTYRVPVAEVEAAFELLTGHLAAAGVGAIVIEVADGLYQRETAALLSSPRFGFRVDTVLFNAGEAMAAEAGVAWLRQRRLPVRAVAGLMTASPLATREAMAAVDLPVLTLDDLAEPAIAERFQLQALAA